MEDASDLKLDELRAMRDEMSHLSRLLREHFDGSAVSTRDRTLNVNIEVVESERKPVLVAIRGGISISVRLSYVRASLLIALLADLRDRCDGGGGLPDLLEAASELWLSLDPTQPDDGKAPERLRVALYRIGGFLETIAPSVGGLSMALDTGTNQLCVRAADGSPLERLEIDIRARDPRHEATLQRVAETSPLMLIRRRKAVFFPMDAAAIDRLHLAFFRSAGQLRVRSLSFQLSHWLYPQALLERTAATAERRELARLALQRITNGTATVTEIVQRACLWDSIRENSKGKFQCFPLGARTADVVEYLDRLIELCAADEGFRLVLTESELPFFVVTYEVLMGAVSECFTLLFRTPSRGEGETCSCFAVYGDQFLERIREQVLEWTLQRSGTVADGTSVAEEVRRVRAALVSSGPLAATAPQTPDGDAQSRGRLRPGPADVFRSSPWR